MEEEFFDFSNEIEFKTCNGHSSKITKKKDKFIATLFEIDNNKEKEIETKEFSNEEEAHCWINNRIKSFREYE